MNKLNHFIFEENDNLINITTKKILPKNSSKKELEKNFFLENQEEDCINHHLFEIEKTSFSINVIPTWECNLRCNHCFVLDQLVKKDSKELDHSLLENFIFNLIKKYPTIKHGKLSFLGGEPTLKSKQNNILINKLKKIPNIKMSFVATCNGTICDEDSIEFYKNLDSFTISLDGTEKMNNTQRKSLNKENPYELTMKTIEKLIELGMRDKMQIQASLQEEIVTKENMIEFYKQLLMIGVKIEKIIFGYIAPTKHNPKIDNMFVEIHKNPRTRPCCKYRHMNNFVVDTSNNVFCDFFDPDKDNFLGKLSDSIEQMSENHKNIIKKSFSVLNDPKCKKCPVIGMCWGWCANTKSLNPSDYCDQNSLIEKVKKNSEQNNLTNFITNSKNDVTLTK